MHIVAGVYEHEYARCPALHTRIDTHARTHSHTNTPALVRARPDVAHVGSQLLVALQPATSRHPPVLPPSSLAAYPSPCVCPTYPSCPVVIARAPSAVPQPTTDDVFMCIYVCM